MILVDLSIDGRNQLAIIEFIGIDSHHLVGVVPMAAAALAPQLSP